MWLKPFPPGDQSILTLPPGVNPVKATKDSVDDVDDRLGGPPTLHERALIHLPQRCAERIEYLGHTPAPAVNRLFDVTDAEERAGPIGGLLRDAPRDGQQHLPLAK